MLQRLQLYSSDNLHKFKKNENITYNYESVDPSATMQ